MDPANRTPRANPEPRLSAFGSADAGCSSLVFALLKGSFGMSNPELGTTALGSMAVILQV
jgi:hypothetical protein